MNSVVDCGLGVSSKHEKSVEASLALSMKARGVVRVYVSSHLPASHLPADMGDARISIAPADTAKQVSWVLVVGRGRTRRGSGYTCPKGVSGTWCGIGNNCRLLPKPHGACPRNKGKEGQQHVRRGGTGWEGLGTWITTRPYLRPP